MCAILTADNDSRKFPLAEQPSGKSEKTSGAASLSILSNFVYSLTGLLFAVFSGRVGMNAYETQIRKGPQPATRLATLGCGSPMPTGDINAKI